ncbi:MAG: hypothetical protein ACYC5G_05400 [Candidatus Doudnabacteria bacterium]
MIDKKLLFGFEEKEITKYVQHVLLTDKERLDYLYELRKIIQSIVTDEYGFSFNEVNHSSENEYIKHLISIIKKRHKRIGKMEFETKVYDGLRLIVYNLKEKVDSLISYYSDKIKLTQNIISKRNKKLGNADANSIARIFYSMYKSKIIEVIPKRNLLAELLVSDLNVKSFSSNFNRNLTPLRKSENQRENGYKDQYVSKKGELLSAFVIHLLEINFSSDDVEEIFRNVKKKK